jgi:hypothetical protein
MKTCLIIAFILSLVGCESTRSFVKRHPIATGIGTAVLLGSVAATIRNNSSSKDDTHDVRLPPDPCRQNPQSCR